MAERTAKAKVERPSDVGSGPPAGVGAPDGALAGRKEAGAERPDPEPGVDEMRRAYVAGELDLSIDENGEGMDRLLAEVLPERPPLERNAFRRQR
jgi:hypothetical protein